MAVATATLIAAGIAAAATAYSAKKQSDAANAATDATSAAAASATGEQKRQFDISRQDQMPWLVTGTSALNKLAGMYGLDTYQPNFSALNTPGGATGQTPGVTAALATSLDKSQNAGQAAKNSLLDPTTPFGFGGSLLGLNGLFGKGPNNSPMQDIRQALEAGIPVSDASWAEAGYGPGGTALSTSSATGLQQPVAGNINQPNVAPGAATGTPGAPGVYTPGSAQPGVDPYATFYQSPDYQFRLTQGLAGVDAGAAAGGYLDSGATRKAEIEYAGNLTSGEYNNYANRLAALAGVGQTTATNLGNLGSQYATNVGNIATNQGNNLASSYLAQGQNYSNTIGNLAGIGSGLIMNNPQWFSGSGGGGSTTPSSYTAPYNMNWG